MPRYAILLLGISAWVLFIGLVWIFFSWWFA